MTLKNKKILLGVLATLCLSATACTPKEVANPTSPAQPNQGGQPGPVPTQQNYQPLNGFFKWKATQCGDFTNGSTLIDATINDASQLKSLLLRQMGYAEAKDATNLTTLEFYGDSDSTKAKTSRRVEVYWNRDATNDAPNETLHPDYVLEKNEFLSSLGQTPIAFNPTASHQLSGTGSEIKDLLTFDLGEDSSLCPADRNHLILVLEPSAAASKAGMKGELETHRKELIAEIRKNDLQPLQAAYDAKLQAAQTKIEVEIQGAASTACTIGGLDTYTINGTGAYADTTLGGKTIQAFRDQRDAALAALGDGTTGGLKKDLNGAKKHLENAKKALSEEKTKVVQESLKSMGTGKKVNPAEQLCFEAEQALDTNSKKTAWEEAKKAVVQAETHLASFKIAGHHHELTQKGWRSDLVQKISGYLGEARSNRSWQNVKDPENFCKDSGSIGLLNSLTGTGGKIKAACTEYSGKLKAYNKAKGQAKIQLELKIKEIIQSLKTAINLSDDNFSRYSGDKSILAIFNDHETAVKTVSSSKKTETESQVDYKAVLTKKIEELFDSHRNMSGQCGNAQWQEQEKAEQAVSQAQAAHDLKADEQKAAQDALDGFLTAVKADNNHPFITTHLNANDSGAAEGQLKKEWVALQAASAKDDAAIETEAQATFKEWDSEKDADEKTLMATTITPHVAEKITKIGSADVIKSTTTDSAQKRTLQLWTLGEVLEKIKKLTTAAP